MHYVHFLVVTVFKKPDQGSEPEIILIMCEQKGST